MDGGYDYCGLWLCKPAMPVFRWAPRQICGIFAAVLILVLSNLLLGFFTGFRFTLTPIYDNTNFYDIPISKTEHEQINPAKVPGRHIYLSNGLLQVNEDGPHPIYELMKQAEKDWKGKLERASTTLEQAVREYRRRYHRYPPKGFDIW